MLYSLKPKFSALTTFVGQLQTQLFFTVWCGMFFGIPLSMYLRQLPIFASTQSASPLAAGIACCAGVAFLIIPLANHVRRKGNYAKTEYLVFRDHIEFEEGFFTVRKKTIRFEDIIEIDFRQNFAQRRADVASIFLATQQDPSPFYVTVNGKRQRSGLLLRDIPEPEAEYERLRDLIAKNRRSERPVERRAVGSVPSGGKS